MAEESTQIVKQYNRPTLVKVGERTGSIIGWRHALLEEHFKWHLGQVSGKWCDVGCLARTMFGRASESNRAAVRKRISPAFKNLLQQGMLLVIDYDNSKNGHGKIKAVKLFERESKMETDFAHEQIARMTRRRELNEEMSRRAMQIVGVETVAP